MKAYFQLWKALLLMFAAYKAFAIMSMICGLGSTFLFLGVSALAVSYNEEVLKKVAVIAAPHLANFDLAIDKLYVAEEEFLRTFGGQSSFGVQSSNHLHVSIEPVGPQERLGTSSASSLSSTSLTGLSTSTGLCGLSESHGGARPLSPTCMVRVGLETGQSGVRDGLESQGGAIKQVLHYVSDFGQYGDVAKGVLGDVVEAFSNSSTSNSDNSNANDTRIATDFALFSRTLSGQASDPNASIAAISPKITYSSDIQKASASIPSALHETPYLRREVAMLGVGERMGEPKHHAHGSDEEINDFASDEDEDGYVLAEAVTTEEYSQESDSAGKSFVEIDSMDISIPLRRRKSS